MHRDRVWRGTEGCKGGVEGEQRGVEGYREVWRGAEGCGVVQSPCLSLVAPSNYFLSG